MSTRKFTLLAALSLTMAAAVAFAQPEPAPPVETPVPNPVEPMPAEPAPPVDTVPLPGQPPAGEVEPPPEVVIPAPPTGPAPVATGVVLGGLDKVAARTAKFQVNLKQQVFYNTLIVTAYACKTRPPEEPPESAAFLDIQERKPDGTIQKIFSGWMFASSPALNALEHPVYDIWVVSCKTAPTQTAAPAPPNT